MQHNYPKLRLQAISGIKWNLLGQVLVYLIVLIGTAILSRLISPSEYGIFGMIAVLTNLANMVVGMGVSLAIIQDNTLDNKDVSSIFWLNIIIGSVVGLIFFIGAPLIAQFYHQPKLIFISRLFSLVFLLHAAKSVPTGLLSKESDFKSLSYGQIISNILSFSVAVVLALNGFGVISLVIQAIVLNLLITIFNFYYVKWFPSFMLRKDSLQKIKSFSLNYLPSQIIDFFSSNLDIVLIGKYLGPRNVGLYGKAMALVLIPINLVSQVFNKSFYPIFSKVQNNSEGIKKIYLKSSKIMALVLFPLYALMIIQAKQVILILFGSQWLESAYLVKVLGVYAIFYSLNSFNETFLLSQGKANWLLKINIVDKIILVILFVVALKFGLIYFAYAKLVVIVIAFIVKFLISGIVHRVTIWFWMKSIYKIILALILLIASGLLIKTFFLNYHPFVLISVVTSLSLFVFAFTLYLLRDESYFEISNMIKGYLRK